METARYVDSLLGELAASAGGDDPAVAEAAARLTRALAPAIRLTLLDVFGEATLELNEQLPSGHVEVRLSGREPELRYVAAPEPERPSPPEDDEELSLARISLRLAEALKGRIELAASREGLSVNAWIVRALARSVEPPARGGRRLTGYARS
jgi:HicB family